MSGSIWTRPEGRQVIWMTFASWLLVLAAYQLTEAIAGRFGWLADVPVDVPAVLLVAALVLPAYPLAVALRDAPGWRRWTAFFLAAVGIAFLQGIVNMLENRFLGVIASLDVEHLPLIRARFARSMRDHLYMTFANITLIAFTIQVRDRAADRIELAEVSARADRERLVALRLQLNPHFLFNTLNAVSSLVATGRVDDADEMIGRLSDFLRQTLEDDATATVPLGQELAALDTYLAVERIRLGERLRLDVAIERPLHTALTVPSFILQPLVENAIKYGVAPLARPVTVALSARSEGAAAVLEVRDDGAGEGGRARALPGTGVGLANVRQRLAMAYGGAAHFDAGPGPTGGWVARLTVPMAPLALS